MLRGVAVGAATKQTISYVISMNVVIPAAFVVNSTVGVRVALYPLGNVTVMVTL